MSTPWSRRAPFPWSIEVDVGDGTGWHGLMLKPTQAGLMTGKMSDFLGEVAPTSYEYGAARPDEETTFVFGRLVGGMGELIQSSATSRRYRYAIGVDCSIGGMPRLGPLFAAATLPAPLGATPLVRQFVVGPGPSGDALFVLRGQGVYLFSGGAFALSHDFGAGNDPLQAAVFQGTAGSRRLLVATQLGQLWGYDGTAWLPADFQAGEAAQYVEVVADEVYIGAANAVRRATDDPLVAGMFGGEIGVGHRGTRVTYLRAVADTLYIFKSDGIYTLNADGSDNDLFPELRPQAATSNGVNATPWRDALWFAYGDAYYRLGADAALAPIGPERLVENTGPVRGVAVTGAAHADWFLYLGLHNATTGVSYLLKYGTWTPGEPGTAPANYHFDDVWNGALASWSKQVTRLDVVHLGQPTLWVGFADGSVESTALPTRTPDPAADVACRFQSVGQLYWPLHDAVFGADKKAFHGVTALGPALSAGQSARQYWRTDPAAAYAALTPDVTTNGQRLEFPDLTTGAPRDAATGLQLDAYTELRTSASTLTPVLEGIALHEAVRPAAGDPAMRLSWTATVAAGNRVVRRDGVLSRVTAEAVLGLVRAAATAAGHIRVRGPDGVVVGVAAIEYAQSLAPETGRDGLEHDVPVRFVQFR
jgi:hypothetical protein